MSEQLGTSPHTASTLDDGRRSWAELLTDTRPVTRVFGSSVPELGDVMVVDATLDHARLPRADVGITFFDLPLRLPPLWREASAGGLHLVFDDVSVFSLESWPSDDRGQLRWSGDGSSLRMQFLGAASPLEVVARSVSVTSLRAYR